MVSAFSLCLLTIGITVVSSQVPGSSDGESYDAQVSERRTFSKGKPVKFFPLIKKHKKTGGLLPHVFGKTHYAEVPIIQEAPVRPLYKFHRYQGIEVKPVSDVPISAPEPIVETHSVHGDYAPSFSSDHSFSGHPSSGPFFLPEHDKPVFTSGPSFPEHVYSSGPSHAEPTFSAPSAPAFAPLPPLAPVKTVFSFVPVHSSQIAPIFSPIPFSLPPPAFSPISLARPAPAHVLPPAPAPAPSPAPVFTAFPAPQPAALPTFPIKLHAPAIPAPSPAPIFSHVSLAPPPSAPAFPAIPQISFSAIPAPSPAPAFSAIPAPSPAPISLPALPTAAPALSSISISSSPEPEFPYPPSGAPIPSYIKDISFGDIDTKDSSLPTVEPVDVHHAVHDETSKNLEHVLGVIKTENNLLQKLKGWKADKANAALNHFTHFKHKPTIQPITIPHNKLPLEIPSSQLPIYPTLQFSGPVRPLPLAPAPVFYPPAHQFFPGAKYESFPPNTIESPPLFNSYGVPIPHDSYAPHGSHDRLAPAASEEEPAVLPPPSAEQKQEQSLSQQPETQPQTRPEFQPQNFQPQFQPQSLISHEQPIYVPGDNKTVKEESKASQEVLPERDNYQAEPEANADAATNYPNHKE